MTKATVLLAAALLGWAACPAQDRDIVLPERSHRSSASIMDILQNRHSSTSHDGRSLSPQDLSDLLWAARGVNRPDGKLTSPTAMNSQDVDVMVCDATGVYVYDAAKSMLRSLLQEDIRPIIESAQPTGAPVILLIVTDSSRYPRVGGGTLPDIGTMCALDAGIVCGNITLFCSSAGMATRPRVMMDREAISERLGLTENQTLWLNMPVGYETGK